MSSQIEYDIRCKIIKNLINITHKSTEITFERYFNNCVHKNIEYLTRIIITSNGKYTSITIEPDSTYENIERGIKIKLNDLKSDNKIKECNVCLNDTMKFTTCNKCSNYFCISCYIEIFKTNKGIIICPFCRDKFGTIMSDDMTEFFVKQMKLKHNL